MRKLLIVPVFHTGAEMGSVRAFMERASESAFGKAAWEEHKRDLDRFWADLEASLKRRLEGVDLDRVKLYQDGQVIDGPLGIKIVEEIAEQGSKNHQIVLGLIQRGATLMRTENFELLKEEYKFIKGMATARSLLKAKMVKDAYRGRRNDLLKERDLYIAKNIARSLKDGDLGVLFIGATHHVKENLPKDIEVEYPEGIMDTASRIVQRLERITQ